MPDAEYKSPSALFKEAVESGDLELVRNFDKTSVVLTGSAGFEAMRLAIRSGRKMVKALLTGNIDLDAIKGIDTRTPLQAAAFLNELDIVKSLIAHGADPNVIGVGRYQITPLFIAAGKGSNEMVSFLIKSGSHIDTQNHNGDTALINACERGNEEMVKLLLESGADHTLRNGYSEDAHAVAFKYRHSLSCSVLEHHIAKLAARSELASLLSAASDVVESTQDNSQPAGQPRIRI